MNSEYLLQADEKSFCPVCRKPVCLLCRRDGRTRGWPWFYICFGCQLVAQVGEGEVPRAESEGSGHEFEGVHRGREVAG